jgi:uncharacterized protein involved in exopolysaccharide biosynthesis
MGLEERGDGIHSTRMTDSGLDDLLNVDELKRIIGRRRRTFFLMIAAGLAVLGAVVATQSKSYLAKSDIAVTPISTLGEMAGLAAVPIAAQEDIRVATVLEVLRSRATSQALAVDLRSDIDLVAAAPETVLDTARRLFGRIARLFGTRKTSEALLQSGAQDERLYAETSAVMDMVSVERVSASRLINIYVRAQSPQAAVRLANELPEVYIDLRRQNRERDALRRIERLRGDLEVAGVELYEAELAFARYMRDNDLLVPAATSAIEARIASVESALANARNESIARRLTQLQEEENELEKKLASLSLVYGAGYPEIIDASRKLEEVRTQIALEEQEVKSRIRAGRSNLDASAAALSTELQTIRGRHFEALEAAAGLRELERQVQSRTEAFSALTERLQQEEQDSRIYDDDISVSSLADVALVVEESSTGRFLAVGLFGVVMLAFMGVLVAEGLDSAVRTRRQVWRLMDAPTTGMIPDARRIWSFNGRVTDFLDRHPSDLFTVAVRNLFLELMSKTWEERPRLIVISALSGTKEASTIAAALAHVAADFDCCARILKLSKASSGADKESRIKEVRAGSLWRKKQFNEPNHDAAVTTSLVVQNDSAGSRISTRNSDQKFEDIVQGADLVIIETPSIFETRDAKALAPFASDVLVLVEWGRTPPSALKAVRGIFGDQPNVSAVITRVNWRAHARRGYGDEIEFSQH